MAAGKLSGKAVIVTGGGRGLGRAMAFGLAKAGADVCIAAHIQDDIVSIKENTEIMVGGGRVIALLADLRAHQRLFFQNKTPSSNLF